ncbi:hypothetical protein, partial [Meinhardsimonia xiamenensis]
ATESLRWQFEQLAWMEREGDLPRPELTVAYFFHVLTSTHAACIGDDSTGVDFEDRESLLHALAGLDRILRRLLREENDPCARHEKVVERLLILSENDPDVHAALNLFAIASLEDEERMCAPLRRFVIEVLRGERKPPSGRGARRIHPFRDLFICYVLDDLVWRWGLHPTRNDATEPGMSGCDIVAEAMRRLDRQPASYDAIKRIWLNMRV